MPTSRLPKNRLGLEKRLGKLAVKLEECAHAHPHRDILSYFPPVSVDIEKLSNWDIKREVDWWLGQFAEQFIKGDRLAALMPAGSREFHMVQLAAAHAGFVVVKIDPNLEDPETLANILAAEGAKMLMFPAQKRYKKLIKKAIPEFDAHDVRSARRFISATVPKMRLFLAVGELPKRELDCNDIHGAYVDCAPLLQQVHDKTQDTCDWTLIDPHVDSDLIEVEYDASGAMVATRTAAEAYADGSMPVLSAIVDQKHTEFG